MNTLPIWNHTHTAINDPGYAAHPDFVDPNFVKPLEEKAVVSTRIRKPLNMKGSGKGTHLQKGSAAAKAYMAKLRAMRGKGVRAAGVPACGGKGIKRRRRLRGGFDINSLFTNPKGTASGILSKILENPFEFIKLLTSYWETLQKFYKRMKAKQMPSISLDAARRRAKQAERFLDSGTYVPTSKVDYEYEDDDEIPEAPSYPAPSPPDDDDIDGSGFYY